MDDLQTVSDLSVWYCDVCVIMSCLCGLMLCLWDNVMSCLRGSITQTWFYSNQTMVKIGWGWVQVVMIIKESDINSEFLIGMDELETGSDL